MTDEETREAPATSEAETSPPADLESLKKALAEEQDKAARYLANWQRAQADLANYRRVAEQDKEEMSRLANAGLVLQLLPVIDDLERALAAVPEKSAHQGWVEGFRLIGQKLLKVMAIQGLERIKAVGEPFDPHVHEALMQAKGKDGIVLEECEKGYKYRERVIRPSKVIVGMGEGDSQTPEKKED